MNPFDLTGSTAVVTGGGRGLGLGISQAVLRAGADVVVLAGREPEPPLQELASELGRRLWFQPVDLADAEAVSAAAAALLAEHEVDILINNAGTQDRYDAVDFPLDAWEAVVDINLRAVFQLCQAFGREMVARGSGKIVNLASLLSFQGGFRVSAYAASKGGVAQLTKALCNEWAASGVTVNAIAPGYMATDMNEALLNDPVRLEQLSVRIPAGRWGTPADIGDVSVFLASRAAAYIHGEVITVDGGWMAR